MPFTDENLKRLKEFRLQGYHTFTAFEQNEIVDLVDALLARLEAAERVIHGHMDLEKEKINYDQFVTLLSVWRKACGRTE